ncbi:DNA topoisomerase III [Vallitalea okinawensis]|uniref:DNA topoisomerase III n=1 Tax=Vallitalea okinawensis TaxID=2078660 RepID=UPI000CFCC19A|nr:DNA topoisomerase III [Vallitalea okinawensis]
MGKVLVVAEKPSVARDYAKVLGCKTKKNGYIDGDEYMITWALGHLVTLAEPHHYDEKYKSWRTDDLPIKPAQVKLRVNRKTSSQFNIVKKLMNDKSVEYIICGTDSGREGELIFRYIYHHAKCKKPIKRLWISSMTDIAIKRGFDNIEDGQKYDTLYYSAKCRSEADWLVGMNASRAFTLKYNTLLSIGRVQTPTLAIIVERHHEIENFKPEDYFELDADFGEYKGTWIDKDNNKKIKTQAEATRLMEKIHYGTGVVASVEKKNKKTPPPLLYDLTELQRDANKKYGYSAKKTLSIAQDLYEKRKLLTYPRTDSRYITDDMKDTVRETLYKLNRQPFTPLLKQIKELKFTKRIVNNKKVTDHHAIIPTNVTPQLEGLNKDEFQIYMLVAARLIEAFYPHYQEEATEIITMVNDESFVTKGKHISDLGFKEVKKVLLNEVPKEADELPLIQVDETYEVKNAIINKKQTKPPKTYTEASLLSAMEHAGKFVEDEAIKEKLKEMGLGTPATRASIIERLIHVGYITRKGKTLIPTEKGIKLVSALPPQIKTPEMTGKWERGLKRIHDGTMAPDKFMDSINRYVDYLVGHAANEKTTIVFPMQPGKKKRSTGKKTFGKCPLCEYGSVYENTKAYYCDHWKQGCSLTIWKDVLEKYGVKLENELMRTLLSDKKIAGYDMYLPQTGEKCKADIVLDEKGQVKLLNVVRVAV